MEEYCEDVIEPEDIRPVNYITLSEFLDFYVQRMYQELDNLFPKHTDREIADAVLTLFKARKDIELLKKKALYIYIREITDCKTPHLTQILSVLKKEFYKEYQDKLQKGILDIG